MIFLVFLNAFCAYSIFTSENYLQQSLKYDQTGEIYEVYNKICEKTIQAFKKPNCIKFNRLSLKSLCTENFLILFLIQFEVSDIGECKEDFNAMEILRNHALQSKNSVTEAQQAFLETIKWSGIELIETTFNYLKVDIFNDDYLWEFLTKIQANVQTICMEFKYGGINF